MTELGYFLTAALAAARRGWHVFPLTPGRKTPAVRDWENRATIDTERIRRCWSTGPYNVGIACGPSRLLVVDLDTAKPGEQAPQPWRAAGVTGGMDMFLVICDQAKEYPPLDTYELTTPSGGTHLYYQVPEGRAMRSTIGTLGWHIDTRGPGGYVVAAGSVVDGKAYTITTVPARTCSVGDSPAAPMVLPVWLAVLLRPLPPPAPPRPVRLAGADRETRYLRAVLAAETARVHNAPKGQRNACLYVAAVALGQLVAGNSLCETDARDTLRAAAARHIGVGAYSAAQADKTITSGLRAGVHRPRAVAA